MKSKHEITIEMLERAKEDEVLFQGEIEDSVRGINVNNTGKMLKYIAIRGEAPDWTIYFESCFHDMDYDDIRREGGKIFITQVKTLIKANKKVWERYRC